MPSAITIGKILKYNLIVDVSRQKSSINEKCLYTRTNYQGVGRPVDEKKQPIVVKSSDAKKNKRDDREVNSNPQQFSLKQGTAGIRTY